MTEEENKEIVNCEHWFAGECMKFGGLCKDYKVESCSIKKTIDEEIKELKSSHEKEMGELIQKRDDDRLTVEQSMNNIIKEKCEYVVEYEQENKQLKERIEELEAGIKEFIKLSGDGNIHSEDQSRSEAVKIFKELSEGER